MCENTYEKYMMEYQKALDETYGYTKDKEKKMKIKKGTEQGYEDWYNKNLDPYGHACFTYAERWAEMMESKINELRSAEEAIINHAERFFHEAIDMAIEALSAEPEIIRCKDCKYRVPETKGCRNGAQWRAFPKRDDDYCSWAERKENE